MEVYEAIRTVLAVRAYEDKPLASDAIRRIVEAGRLTASSMNRQPWHFVVIEDKEMLKKLGALARTGPYLAQAAAAIVVVIDRTVFAVSDGSRAIQSMVLEAWSEGIASNWVGFMALDELKPVLDIPEDKDILAVVSLGYPAQIKNHGKKNRTPLAEVASRGKFGQPFV
jgi:nitroreductase